MFRRSPRAALLAAAALVVAVATTVLVVDSLTSLRHQDEEYGRLHPLVTAHHDLPIGTRVRARDLDVRRVRGQGPAGLTDPADAVGRIVRVPVLAATPVTADHLTGATRGRRGTVPPGRRAVRLVVEHGLRPAVGDLVDVYATFDPQVLGDTADPTVLVAPAVPVLAVGAVNDGADAVAVTVLVTPHQAARLAFSTVTGVVSLALAPPEAATGSG